MMTARVALQIILQLHVLGFFLSESLFESSSSKQYQYGFHEIL